MSRSTDYTVIQLADFGAPYAGNFIASLLALESVLKKAGFRQALIFPDRARDKAWLAELRKNKVSVYVLPKASTFYNIKEIAKIAVMENAVILHTHFTAFDVAACLARIMTIKKRNSLNIVWQVHSNFPIRQTIIRRLKDIVKLQMLGRSVEVIAVTEEIKQSFDTRGFRGHSYVVPNGIDICRATGASKSRSEIRKELGIQEKTLLLLSFGWEPVTKGIDLLIHAAKELSNDMKFTLLIIGTDQLREFILKQFVGGLPAWLKISEPKQCVADLYQAADIFVSASRWEGCPYSVMEAMANGLPVISSNIRALAWVRPAKGVVFFDLSDTQSLIQAIKQVINWSPQELLFLKKSNREFIEKNFHVDTWAQNIWSIYEEIMNCPKTEL